MKKVIITVTVVIIVIIAAITSGFLLFDNTTDKVVSEDNMKVIILIDDNISDNSVNAQLIVENHNGFDINMLDIYCSNNNAYFDIQNEGVFAIENDETFSYDFTITFSEDVDSNNYLSLVEQESILVSFNANDANQNDIVTQIKPEIKQ